MPAVRSDGRVALIDNARAIGIVLVVEGHAPSLPGPLRDLIFAFHMPLFFLSGRVVGRERLQESTVHRARLLSRTLLLPYAFYFALSWAFWLLVKRHGLRAAAFESYAWWDPLIGFATGTGDRLYVNVALWFLPALFVTALVHHVVRKACSARTVAVASTTVAFVFVMLHDASTARWPWSVDCAVVGLAFFAIGAALNVWLRHPPAVVNRSGASVVALLAGAGCAGLAAITGPVDLNHVAFGPVAVLYLPMGALGTMSVLVASTLLPPSRVARWLSNNTLVIFPLHLLMFSVFTGVALRAFGLDPGFKETWWIGMVYTVLALLLSWPAAIVLRRTVPWLFGRHRPTASRTMDDGSAART